MTQKTRANFKTGQATTFADNSAGDISAADLRGEMDNIADSAIFPEDGAAIKTAYEAESDTNAYTDSEKSKLSAIEAGAEVNTVDSVAGETGAITASDLRTAINVEDGATADQSGPEIEAAYNAQVGAMSQATAEAGTSTTIERVTAQRIAQAIAAQAVSLPASPTNGDVLGWDTGALAWMSPLAISTLTEETTPASGMLFIIENAGTLYKVDYDNMPSGGIADVVDDTTPQLGGDLDANGNDIDMGTNTITDTKVGQWDTAHAALPSGDVVGTSDTQTLTGKTIDGDSNTISNLDLGNEVDWPTAGDVTDASAFESGDKLLIHEAGVGLRKIDYDDLPGAGGGVDTSGTPVANDFARFTDADTIEGRSYAEVRADLGLEIGTDVQAYDANLISWPSAVSATEVGYLDGVTSAIQTQLDAKEAADADILKADTADTLTAGFDAADHAAGTKSTGTFTPDPADGNFQTATNGGAHTLAPPGSSCCIVIAYTNNGSAGAITTSGFTQVTGDSFDTTDGNDFLCHVTRCGGFSHLHVTALQ